MVMESNAEAVVATRSLDSSYNPLPASLQLKDLPSLMNLLVETFGLTPPKSGTTTDGDRANEDATGEIPNKRPKLALVPPPSVHVNLSGSKVVTDAADLIVGIPWEEFSNEPFIQLAVVQLLRVLENVFVRRYGNSLNNIQLNAEVKEQVNVLEEEVESLKRGLAQVEQLLNHVWEQLNVGHWKTVPRFWRKFYTCLTILKVTFMVLKACSNLDVIRECDMGLLMGEPICDNVLSNIAEELCAKIIDENTTGMIEIKTKAEETTSCSQPTTTSLAPHPSAAAHVPLKNKSENNGDIFVTENPWLEEFISSHMETSTPGLFLNLCNTWPAMSKWSVGYIEKVAGFRSVPVEVGQRYTSEDWTQKIMTISEFIQKYIKGKSLSTSTSSSSSDANLCQPPAEIGYIAQYTLFDQLPQLYKDISIPDLCTLGKESMEKVEINAWFGPANTISPCHYDPKHNILVQVFGSKAIRLFSPDETSRLRPYPVTSLLFNTSTLDVEADDLFETYPDMRTVHHFDVILRAGQALYIPPRWWHYVKSLEPSFSVSFWFE